jgi:hypothetical protein
MTVVGAGNLLVDVNDVRKVERLHGHGTAIEEVVQRVAERRSRGREHLRRLPGQQGRGRRCGNVAFDETATDAAGKNDRADGEEAHYFFGAAAGAGLGPKVRMKLTTCQICVVVSVPFIGFISDSFWPGRGGAPLRMIV